MSRVLQEAAMNEWIERFMAKGYSRFGFWHWGRATEGLPDGAYSEGWSFHAHTEDLDHTDESYGIGPTIEAAAADFWKREGLDG